MKVLSTMRYTMEEPLKNDLEFVLQSPKINDLLAALMKAQDEMETVVNNKINPHFKSRYADLAAMKRVGDPVLKKYGLIIKFNLVYLKDERQHLLNTLICLPEKDQWDVASQMLIVPIKEKDPQAFGSYLSYAKRYSYQLASGINVADEADDDGERCVREQEKNIEVPMDTVQFSQVVKLLSELPEEKRTSLSEWLCQKADVDTIVQLPASRYNWAIATITKAKERSNEK